jgi:hypothetical protein
MNQEGPSWLQVPAAFDSRVDDWTADRPHMTLSYMLGSIGIRLCGTAFLKPHIT